MIICQNVSIYMTLTLEHSSVTFEFPTLSVTEDNLAVV